MARKKSNDPDAALRRARAIQNKNKWEIPFITLFRAKHPDLPVPERDYQFAPPRRWKIDFALPCIKVGVELNGGGGRSRHASVTGHKNDCDKLNMAVMTGWKILQFNVIHLKKMDEVVEFAAQVIRANLHS